MKLGILGGSFNPVHHGHLVIAERAAEAVGLDRVLFIPTAISPLKERRALASTPDRWTMLKLAIRGNPLFRASDLEIRRGGVSYTVDTLRELKRRTKADLHVILGADASRLLPRWKSIEAVKRLAIFVLVSRPDHRVRSKMPKQHVVEAPLLEISSTEIRERVRRGLSIRYLVPEAVERHIRRRGLYR